MDWFHCNRCYIIPQGEVQKSFYLTSCGHIYCHECVAKIKNICQICNKGCQTLSLAPPLREDIANYFTESSEKLQRLMQECMKILAFQKGHRLRLTSFFVKQCKVLNENMGAARKRLAEQEREIQYLKNQNAHLKQMLDESIGKNTDAIFPSATTLRNVFGGSSAGLVSARSLQINSAGQSQTPSSGGRLSIQTPPSSSRLGQISGPSSESSQVSALFERIQRSVANNDEALERLRAKSQPKSKSLAGSKIGASSGRISSTYSARKARPSPIGLKNKYPTGFFSLQK